MRIAPVFVAIAIIASTFDIHAQQPAQATPPAKPPQQAKPPQRRVPATATLAITVTDPAGAEIPNVLVTAEGPTPRTSRTEGGRIAFENLRAGEYLLRFEKDGFLTLERQLTARAGKPVEVRATLKPAPEPPAPAPPPARTEEAREASAARPAAFDVPAIIEKEFIGRAAVKSTPLVCGDDANATLIQLNDPVSDHTHADSDEFLYVVAGEGAASVGGAAQKLRAGVLLFVPRGAVHRFSRSGRNPLIVVSIKAGGECQGPAQR